MRVNWLASIDGWPGDIIGWLDRHSGSMTVLVSAAAGTVAIVLAFLTWKTLQATQAAVELERANAQRGSEPMVRASLESQADTHVKMGIRNIGLGPAVDLMVSYRDGQGSGAPVTGWSTDALRPGETRQISLARFPPEGTAATAEFDLVYSDARQSFVKRQLWEFYLAHDVVTMGEYSHLVHGVRWPEEIVSRQDLVEGDGSVRISGEGKDETVMQPDSLASAWLLKFGSKFSGSRRYLRALRAIEERDAGNPLG